jgi:hypothetical protein
MRDPDFFVSVFITPARRLAKILINIVASFRATYAR